MTSAPKASEMVEMVERVAKAICQGRGYDPEMIVYRGVPYLVMGEMAYSPQGEPHPAWHLFVRDARAAIAAMRARLDRVATDRWTGPKEAVQEIGADYVRGFDAACASHRAMIDSALSEEVES